MFPWEALVLLVKKNDETLWFCIEYKKLNKVIIKNRNTFPRIDDLFNQMKGDKVFSKVKLRLGFHQVRIKDEYINKTTFLEKIWKL